MHHEDLNYREESRLACKHLDTSFLLNDKNAKVAHYNIIQHTTITIISSFYTSHQLFKQDLPNFPGVPNGSTLGGVPMSQRWFLFFHGETFSADLGLSHASSDPLPRCNLAIRGAIVDGFFFGMDNIGILRLYYNGLYVTGENNPLCTLKQPGFFHGWFSSFISKQLGPLLGTITYPAPTALSSRWFALSVGYEIVPWRVYPKDQIGDFWETPMTWKWSWKLTEINYPP